MPKTHVSQLSQLPNANVIQDELLELGLKTSKAMVFLQDTELNYIWVKNKHAALDNLEFIGKHDSQVYLKSDAQKLTKLKTQAVINGKSIHENVVLCLGNKSLTFLLSVEPFYSADAELMGIMGAMNDITYYKMLENNLTTTLNLYTSLVENQTDLICRFNENLEFTFVNKQMETFMGMTNDELIGVNWLEVVEIDNKDQIKNFITQWLKHPQTRYYENTMKNSSGQQRTIQWIDTPIMDKSGEIVEFQSVGRDVTEIYQSKQQIEAQNDTLLQQAEKLTNLNTTLQYLLEQAETNRLQYEQNIKKQISLMVTPILNKLSSGSTTEMQKQYINLLMTNLNQLTAKEKSGLDLSLAMLTQREIEIALLIKDGKSTQDIADLLFLSENTVKTHRKNLRSKLKCKKHNLQTYLRMIMKY